MNRTKRWYHKVKIYEGTNPVIKKEKSPQLVYYNAHEGPFVFRKTVSFFSQRGSKTFCLFPANSAAPGNITRNDVSATMFLSLTRPLGVLFKISHEHPDITLWEPPGDVIFNR